MSEDIDLRCALMSAIAAADGVATVNNRTMIKTDVARSVIRAFVAELFSEVRDQLSRIALGNAAAEEKLAAQLDESERWVEKLIFDKLPMVQ